MKRTVEEASQIEAQVRATAHRLGLALRVTWPTCGHAQTAHWMFSTADGRRALDWWPGTGRFWAQHHGERGRAEHGWEALAVAVKMAERMANADEESEQMAHAGRED